MACGLECSGWQLVTLTVDSGASETVCHSEHFPNTPVNQDSPKHGLRYKGASGNPIVNQGDKKIAFITDEGEQRDMLFQVCDVTKPLASVSRICKKGHRVVFEDGCSYIENLYSGDVTWLREENGVYVMDIWLPPCGRQGKGI